MVGMHATTIEDPGCNFSVLLERSEGRQFKKADRETVERLWNMLPKLRERHYKHDDDKTQVTVTGQFETTYRLQNGEDKPIGHGFGDRGLFPSRLVLQRIDVLPELN